MAAAGGAPAGAPPAVFFRPCGAEDVHACAVLEEAGYPADEAADEAKLAFRQKEAGDFFLVAEDNAAAAVVGFVCGTLVPGAELTEESMSTHDPTGTTLCIHSVCVAEASRRKKVGTKLLAAYLAAVKGLHPEVEAVKLICKPHLVGFYEDAGFEVVGPSPVVHGADPWTEMTQALAAEA